MRILIRFQHREWSIAYPHAWWNLRWFYFIVLVSRFMLLLARHITDEEGEPKEDKRANIRAYALLSAMRFWCALPLNGWHFNGKSITWHTWITKADLYVAEYAELSICRCRNLLPFCFVEMDLPWIQKNGEKRLQSWLSSFRFCSKSSVDRLMKYILSSMVKLNPISRNAREEMEQRSEAQRTIYACEMSRIRR